MEWTRGCGGEDSEVDKCVIWSGVWSHSISGEAEEAELASAYTTCSVCKTPNQIDSPPHLSPLLA